MALKQLMKARKIQEKRAELAQVEENQKTLRQRRSDLEEVEKNLEAALAELTDDSTEEEKAAVQEETDKWSEDDAALTKEEEEAEQKRVDLEQEIAQLTEELDALNAQSAKSGEEKPDEDREDEDKDEGDEKDPEERKERKHMNRRNNKHFGMTRSEFRTWCKREEVNTFLANVVTLAKEKRAVSGASLAIPDVMLDVIREQIDDYSKLLGKVNKQTVGGTARENIVGAVPEAVWMETVANFNELAFNLYQVEVDGFAVGGFIPVPNALLQDSRYPALAEEVMRMLSAAIGMALDKAILYGTGVKMPLGIVTRLAQASKPEKYPATARPWANLSTTNVVKIGTGTGNGTKAEGLKLYQLIAAAASNASPKYGTDGKFWVMSEATWNGLVADLMSINATGAIVSGAEMTMPVLGGEVILLDFMGDGDVVMGYGGCYLLAEREGATLSQSEHVRFLNRQTVFAGEARYDGVPVIAEAFVAMNIKAKAVTTSMTFATDTANAG